MTRAELSSYILIAGLLALVLGAVNLLRPGRRWLGGACVAFGLANLAYRAGMPAVVVGVAGAAALFALGKDAGGRPRRRTP